MTEDCECFRWARKFEAFNARHHPHCKKYDPVKDAAETIRSLIKGIEVWAQEEDGIPDFILDAYESACCSINKIPPTMREGFK